MDREPVKSSVIAAIGYDPDQGTLEVLFHNGKTYRYFGVPPRVHRALLAADSIGGYFNTEVKPNYEGLEV